MCARHTAPSESESDSATAAWVVCAGAPLRTCESASRRCRAAASARSLAGSLQASLRAVSSSASQQGPGPRAAAALDVAETEAHESDCRIAGVRRQSAPRAGRVSRPHRQRPPSRNLAIPRVGRSIDNDANHERCASAAVPVGTTRARSSGSPSSPAGGDRFTPGAGVSAPWLQWRRSGSDFGAEGVCARRDPGLQRCERDHSPAVRGQWLARVVAELNACEAGVQEPVASFPRRGGLTLTLGEAGDLSGNCHVDEERARGSDEHRRVRQTLAAICQGAAAL